MSLRLFEGFGVELEYMIVDRNTLNVSPIADRLLATANGRPASDFELGTLGWSNELVAHVIELKTLEPAPWLDGLEHAFAHNVEQVSRLLDSMNACLLPTAMHPWMNPQNETRLWPEENNEIYECFHRIFNCRGHGWSNLQSMHINLPFSGDEEFARLHAAIRIVLPILPALAASSPIRDGKLTGMMDSRLDVYRHNSARISSVAGRVIPEAVFSESEYREKILERIYRDLAPHDPEGLIRNEWVNARGAIARFTRGAIEIRVLDIQECPRADLAIARAVVEVVRHLAAEHWCTLAEQKRWGVEALEEIFLATMEHGDEATIKDRRYLDLFDAGDCVTAGALWRDIVGRLPHRVAEDDALQVILRDGCLARRIVRAVGKNVTRDHLTQTYSSLARCLATNQMFVDEQSPRARCVA